jgi:adenylate cyclase
MPGKRTRTQERIALAVVPVADRVDLFGDVAAAFAGLTTWLALKRVAATQAKSPADFQRIGATACVRYVLHGWTESERDRLRLTVELNETASGRVLWSDRVDRKLTEREALRADIAERIGQAVPEMLLRRELDRSALEPPEDLTSHDLALLAFAAIMQPRRARFQAAADQLAEAEGKGGALAGTRFAQVWWHLMAISQGWGGDLISAGAAAGRLDQGDPASVALSAYTGSALLGDYVTASARLDLVLDGAPLCGTAASFKALTLCWLNEPIEAIAHAEQASRMPALGPELAWRDHVTALAHYIAGRYEDALRWARISATHHPGLAANIRVMASSLAVLGRLDEARQAASQVLVIDPAFRIGAWRGRSLLPDACLESMAPRLRLAGLPL